MQYNSYKNAQKHKLNINAWFTLINIKIISLLIQNSQNSYTIKYICIFKLCSKYKAKK